MSTNARSPICSRSVSEQHLDAYSSVGRALATRAVNEAYATLVPLHD